jgi:hypothetical protein
MDWIGGPAFALKISTGKSGCPIVSGGIEERMKIEKQFKKVEKY